MITTGAFYDRKGNWKSMDVLWDGRRKERFTYELMEALYDRVPEEGEAFRFGPLSLRVIWNRDSHKVTWAHVRWKPIDIIRYYLHRAMCAIRHFVLRMERRLKKCLPWSGGSMKLTRSIYWYNRCYLRGLSLLGLFNTCVGCLFNRVLVRSRDPGSKKTLMWYWDKAHRWPPECDHVVYEKELITVPSRECTVLTTMLMAPIRFNRGGFIEQAYCEMDEDDALALLEQHEMLTFETTGDCAVLVVIESEEEKCLS